MSAAGSPPVEPALWVEPRLPGDIDALIGAALAEGFDWIAALRAEWDARPFTEAGEGLFVVREGERTLAIAVVSADPFVGDGATGRLRYIFVHPSRRGRGFAEHLLRRCLDRAGRRWRRLRLHTDNPVAAKLYARYGFEPVPAGEDRATHAKVMG